MTDQDLKWWHVRWGLAWRTISKPAIILARVIGVLRLLAAIVAGVCYILAPWLVAQRMCKIDPRVCLIPAGLPTTARAPLSDAPIDLYGFQISLPTKSVDHSFHGTSATMIWLHNGGTVIFDNPAEQFEELNFILGEKKESGILGHDLLQSKFRLMQAAMASTPDQAKWWRFRTLGNMKVQYLLTQKFLFLTAPHSTDPFTLGPIYSISTGGLHGFQIGNPDASPYDVHLDLFDENDRHLAFDISGPENHGPLLTQAEINAIVASIRPN